MPSRDGLSIEFGPGTEEWRRWALAFQGELGTAIDRATKKAVEYVKGEIVRKIRSRAYAPLAPLTAWKRKVEGFSKIPLFKTGALTRAVSGEIRRRGVGAVGLNRTAKGSSGGELVNIAKLLHDGGTIRISRAMKRAFVRYLMAVAKRANVAPPEPTGNGRAIRIRPRRFIEDVFKSKAVQARIEKIYADEIGRRIEGRGARRR